MKSSHHQDPSSPLDRLNERLGESGLRATRQREVVYGVLLAQRDHPTADEIFARAKTTMPSISLATVYNCLETLVQCDLVKPVNFEREPTRYCPNLRQHAHFHDLRTGQVFDVDLDQKTLRQLHRILPAGLDACSIDITFRGSVRETRAARPPAGRSRVAAQTSAR